MSAFGFAMLLLSLFPGLMNLPAELFSLDMHERGRLLTLLIISVVVLWFLVIYERGKARILSQGFDRLVRSLAVDKFFEAPTHIQADSILVIIPAYNEESNLGHIIPGIPKEILSKRVIPLIVDDGSLDQTQEICASFVVPKARNLINRGGGAALRVGFDIAQRLNISVIVTMDGDGQHQTEEIANLVEPIINDEADLVIGSRLLGQMESYSSLRYWGVVLFGRLVSLLIGQRITDPASGFRAFAPCVLENCVLIQDQYHTAELIIESAKRNLRITECPITIKKRLSGKSKKGKNWKYALLFFRTIVKTWFR
jgi:glycosyltransferase involved in cell wall biosynthesis